MATCSLCPQGQRKRKHWSLFFLTPSQRIPTHIPKAPPPNIIILGIMASMYELRGGGDIKLGEGNGTPLQYSCLENPMDGGGWWAAVHGVAKSQTRLRDFTFTFHFHVMEKEMATHSSVLAWRIPGTVESHPKTPSQTHLETMFNQIIGYFMGQTDT